MLTPANRTINVTSGGTALVGRTTAIGGSGGGGTGPAWLTSANPAVGQWIEIPGTVMPSKTIAESFSGVATTPAGKIIAAANGGHTDGVENDVYGIDLSQNSPVWAVLNPRSSTLIYEQPYQPDGKPAASHNYWSQQYMSSVDRVMRMGAVFVALGGNSSFPTTDGFRLNDNTWDAAGVWPYCGSSPYPGPSGGVYPKTGSAEYSGYAKASIGGNGVDTLLTLSGLQTFNVVTKTFSTALSTGLNMPRAPWAYDTTRQEYFGMCYGDGQGSSLFLGVVAVRRNGDTLTPITFNSSAALTQLNAGTPEYAAMTYEPVTDQYLFRSATGPTYAIKPNSSSVWDISIYATTGTLPNAHSSGLNNRFQYVASLGGVVCLPLTANGVFFMRTH